jgi:hypothetical protein
MAAFYRTLSWKQLKAAVIQTAQESSMMLFLAVASNIFGAIFARLGSASLLTDTLVGLPLPPTGTLLVVMLLIFLLGWRYPLGDAGIHGASVDRPAAGDAVPRDRPVVSPLALREVSGAAPPGDEALSGV